MLLSVVLLAHTHKEALVVASTGLLVPMVAGVKDMKALFGMDEEEKPS